MKPDRAKDSDVFAVIEAADLLETSEFRLFTIAYDRWYGRCPDTRIIEAHFTAYLFRSVVPPWVRFLAREILTKALDGSLRLADYGLEPAPADARLLLRGRIYSLTLLLVCLLLLAASLYYDDLVEWLGNCYFPPCY